MDLFNLALYVGLAIGTIILLTLLVVYVKRRSLGNGGVTVLVIGFILVSAPVWKEIAVSIGGIDIKLLKDRLGEIASSQQALGAQLQEVEVQWQEIQKNVALLAVAGPEQIPEIRRRIEVENMRLGDNLARIGRFNAQIQNGLIEVKQEMPGKKFER